jgi:hypothetical protein
MPDSAGDTDQGSSIDKAVATQLMLRTALINSVIDFVVRQPRQAGSARRNVAFANPSTTRAISE